MISRTGQIQVSAAVVISPTCRPGDVDESVVRERDGWEDREGHVWTALTLQPFTHAGHVIHATLRFRDDSLFSAGFGISDDRFGSGWSDWSEAKELARKSEHDRLLDEVLGPDREFSWGTVWSEFDRKGGASSFGVNYKTREQVGAQNP